MGLNRIVSISIANTFLRLLVTFSKFTLLIYIAKYFSTEELGVYGLFTTSITLGVILLGVDFYNFSLREIVKDKTNAPKYLYNQFIFHCIVYLLSIPATLLLFSFKILPTSYLGYFFAILILEHLSQEFYRLYTVLQKPTLANTLLFIRAGLWVYLVISLWSFKLCPKTLSTIWLMWLIGAFTSVVISIVKLSKLKLLRKEHLDWKWIKRGAKTGLLFFAGTLCYKVIEFSDRYMIDAFLSKVDVGIYTFYVNIANLINTIVFASVIMLYYPRLLESITKDGNEYKMIVKKFSSLTLILSILSAFALQILIHPLIFIINKVEFLENIEVFYTMLIANIFLNLSFVPHYILYAAQRDKIIAYSTAIASLVNIFLNILLIKKLGILGAAISTLVSFIIIAAIKGFWGVKLEKYTGVL